MRKNRGFTIVEVTVVVVIVAILATLTVTAYNRVQANARNDAAQSKATVISEALEKFYEKNGRYPTCAEVSNSNASTVISGVLQGVDPDTITRTGATTGTNSINCDEPGTSNFSYNGNADLFTLKYKEEASGEIITFNSRHKAPGSAPSTPIINLAFNSSQNKLIATATASLCSSGTMLYAFQSKTNTGTWTGWSSFGSASTASVTPTAGHQYTYQVRVQCTGNAQTADSAISNTYTHPVTITANPTLAVSFSNPTASATMTSIQCPAGTTAQNQLRYADQAVSSSWPWSSWTALSSSNVNHSHTLNDGWRAVYEGRAFCDGLYADSPTVGTGQKTAVNPMDTPAAPTWNGTAYFFSGAYASKRALANFATYCPTGAWVAWGNFNSYPEWDTSESWFHDFPYNDWWYTSATSSRWTRYYARYNCTTEFSNATSGEGYARIEVKP